MRPTEAKDQDAGQDQGHHELEAGKVEHAHPPDIRFGKRCKRNNDQTNADEEKNSFEGSGHASFSRFGIGISETDDLKQPQPFSITKNVTAAAVKNATTQMPLHSSIQSLGEHDGANARSESWRSRYRRPVPAPETDDQVCRVMNNIG
ncbi:MAG TPA: hypothetical protein VK943_01755 [Arenibaculum sp.]|nr:hypothetical protein [Arenibaculum sp.]